MLCCRLSGSADDGSLLAVIGNPVLESTAISRRSSLPAVEHRACLQALQILKSPSITHQELQQARSYVKGCTLPHKNIGIPGKYTVCANSVSLIKRTQPSLLNLYSPVTVHGDGNCLFRAVGVALFDNESHHLLLRALAALEIREHREWYDVSAADCLHPFRNNSGIVLAAYDVVCKEVGSVGCSCDITAVLALSAVTGTPIQTWWPPLSGALHSEPLTQLVVGRNVQDSVRAIVIMWSSSLPVMDSGPVSIDHFVPLLSRPLTDMENAVNVDESAVYCETVVDSGKLSCLLEAVERLHDGDTVAVVTDRLSDGVCDVADNDAVAVDVQLLNGVQCVVDDVCAGDSLCDHSEVDAGVVADRLFDDVCELKDGSLSAVQEDASVVAGSDSDDDEQCGGDSVAVAVSCVGVSNANVGRARFMSADEVCELLSCTAQANIHAEVPKGPKANTFFVVDNSRNQQRKQDGRKNQFWDDCGSWDSKSGRTVKLTYLRKGKSLSVVKLNNGVYCKQRMVQNKRFWEPLAVQPSSDSIVTLCSYYTALKADKSYKKRVSWFDVRPNVCLFEYQGCPPQLNQPHGLARHITSEYVRTKPMVMDKMRSKLEVKQAPRDVYNQMAVVDDSTVRPRDHKQVRNVAQTVGKEQGQQKGMNVADEIAILFGKLHTHPFVREIRMHQGMSPVIVAFTQEQIRDLKRFCARDTPQALRTVVGVDRTFNLGPCFVTVTVYRNMSVLRKTTRDNPIFLGPVMFHFDGRCDTYKMFFHCVSDALCADVAMAEFTGDVEMVFGTDEEKAMVGALSAAFPTTRHIYCARHIEENVRRFMTDVVGLSAKEREMVLARVISATDLDHNDTCDVESQLSELMEAVRMASATVSNPQRLLSYFTDRIMPKIRNNHEVVRDNMWITRHWTNNNAEAVNHILKQKAGWKQLPVNSVIDNVFDIVRLQFVDLRGALSGRGNYLLSPAFGKHSVPYQVWSTSTDERKDELYQRFLRDTGSRNPVSVVTSKDGVVTLPASAKVARKPGQKTRPRASRTRTPKK